MEDRWSELAEAYVAYAVWFSGEGSRATRAWSQAFRDELAADPVATGDSEVAVADKFLGATTRAGDPPGHPSAWADAEVRRVTVDDGDGGWQLIKAIARHAPRDLRVLGFIGAGPFEDWQSDARLRAVEAEFRELFAASDAFRVMVLAADGLPAWVDELIAAY